MASLSAFADHIDQLDLALDQLSVRDRNFDRFALMLVDNVVELVLHTHARELDAENCLWIRLKKPKYDQKLVRAALGRHFDDKLRMAKASELLSEEVAGTISLLHDFRNDAYHKGRRHEGILHSIALHYFRTACSVLTAFSPQAWVGADSKGVSHRAMKYLGGKSIRLHAWEDDFRPAFKRLREVADAMGDSLAADLFADLSKTVDGVDRAIDFVEENQPGTKKRTRDEIVLDAQVWNLVSSEKARKFAAAKKAPTTPVPRFAKWLEIHYPLKASRDPVPAWRRRILGVSTERNPNLALKKYCDFLAQTEHVTERIHAHANGLEDVLQAQLDFLRGK